jgi:Family of unknown function (DUF6152)
MAIRNAALAVCVSVLAAAAHLNAHHHVGCIYDTRSTQTVTGQIVQIVWQFPHVHIRLQATSGSTAGADWDIETVNPQGLRRQGVESDTLKVGDVLATTAWIAKDGSRAAFTESMTLPNGNTVAFPIADLTCPF